jgi:hypothetical protein
MSCVLPSALNMQESKVLQDDSFYGATRRRFPEVLFFATLSFRPSLRRYLFGLFLM